MLQLKDLDEFVKSLKPNGVELITLHWTVGTYDQFFNNDYHFQILGDGSVHVDPRAFDNGVFVPLAHAWHHNTANIGISLCGMYGATDCGHGSPDLVNWPLSYGKYAPTQAQIASMVKLTALLIKQYRLPLNSIKTHYELAQEDGYPGERWEYKYEGNLLREKINETVC